MAEHLTGLTAAKGFCITMETSVRWELRRGSSGVPLNTEGAFAVQKLLSLIRSHLFTFVFICVTLGGGS